MDSPTTSARRCAALFSPPKPRSVRAADEMGYLIGLETSDRPGRGCVLPPTKTHQACRALQYQSQVPEDLAISFSDRKPHRTRLEAYTAPTAAQRATLPGTGVRGAMIFLAVCRSRALRTWRLGVRSRLET